MANNPVEIPIKLNGLGQIKSELRALKGELANATDPKQMADLAQKAGELSDQLKDANEQVAVFASGSKFEQTSNAFGLMKSQLMDMDFEGAAQSAKIFSSTLTSISPKVIGQQLKGLVSVVGTLGKAFMTFGIQLLANPIFLLIVVITAIVAAVIWFANKMGWLGAIFKAVKEALQPLIDAIKWFLDLIGLTNYAQEERTAAALAGYKAEKEAMEKIGHQLDNKILLL
jgi:phage-related protein